MDSDQQGHPIDRFCEYRLPLLLCQFEVDLSKAIAIPFLSPLSKRTSNHLILYATSPVFGILLVREVLIVVGQPDFRTRAFHVEEGVLVMVARSRYSSEHWNCTVGQKSGWRQPDLASRKRRGMRSYVF